MEIGILLKILSAITFQCDIMGTLHNFHIGNQCMDNKDYWARRIYSYKEMIDHIKKQRAMAESDERKKLAAELERLYYEIEVIKGAFPDIAA